MAELNLLWASGKRGYFPLELTWSLTPFLQNSFRWEYRLRSSLQTCIPSHIVKKSWHSCPRQVDAGNKNTPSMRRPKRRNMTTSVVGLNMVTYVEISPKMVNLRDIAGNTEEEGKIQLVTNWNWFQLNHYLQWLIPLSNTSKLLASSSSSSYPSYNSRGHHIASSSSSSYPSYNSRGHHIASSSPSSSYPSYNSRGHHIASSSSSSSYPSYNSRGHHIASSSPSSSYPSYNSRGHHIASSSPSSSYPSYNSRGHHIASSSPSSSYPSYNSRGHHIASSSPSSSYPSYNSRGHHIGETFCISLYGLSHSVFRYNT